jgi:hypothetical protein
MGLPKTINGKRRPGGGRTRLMKPSSRDAHALKPTRLYITRASQME